MDLGVVALKKVWGVDAPRVPHRSVQKGQFFWFDGFQEILGKHTALMCGQDIQVAILAETWSGAALTHRPKMLGG